MTVALTTCLAVAGFAVGWLVTDCARTRIRRRNKMTRP